MSAGVLPHHFDRVFVGFGTSDGEEEGVDVTGHQLGELGAELGSRLGGRAGKNVRQLVDLGLHGRPHLGVAVTDEHTHQLAVEVEPALAVRPVHVHALGALDGHGIDRAARRPGVEGVPLAQVDHLLGVHESLLYTLAAHAVQGCGAQSSVETRRAQGA